MTMAYIHSLQLSHVMAMELGRGVSDHDIGKRI